VRVPGPNLPESRAILFIRMRSYRFTAWLMLAFMAVYGVSELGMCAAPLFWGLPGSPSGCAASAPAACAPSVPGCQMAAGACCCDHPAAEGAAAPEGRSLAAFCGCSAETHSNHEVAPVSAGFRYLMPMATAVIRPVLPTAAAVESPGRSLAGHRLALTPPPQSHSV
jgi:hypothetical protein